LNQRPKQSNNIPTLPIFNGYTLVELITVIVIIAILATLAVPSFTKYVQRSKLTSSTEMLISLRVSMEQAYQVNRSFQDATGNCVIADFSDDYFSHSCIAASKSTYVWTSTSLATAGLGAGADYIYTINQDGLKTTKKFAGVGLFAYNDWKLRDD